MKLGSADLGVDRLDFTDRVVPREEPVCECLAVARVGVLVGVSYCWAEAARVLLERSGVVLSVSSWIISLSELSRSRSLSLAVCIDTSSSEVYPPSQLLPMLSCSRRARALMTDMEGE